jgi:integrase
MKRRFEYQVVELLQGENVRKGFLAPAEFVGLSKKIPDPDVRDLVAFLYNAGWRSGEGKSLEWSEVDLNRNMISLPAEKSEVEEAAEPFHNRGANGGHSTALSSAATRLPLCVPPPR